MKTTKPEAENILNRIQQIADARIRPMMGEYLVYVDDVVTGQINHNQLFIKVTAFGETYAGELPRESPYDGAKPAFVIPSDKIDDLDWMKVFIAGTVKDLTRA